MQKILCGECGTEMELEVLPRNEYGDRRYRLRCPQCGAHSRREVTAKKAREKAQVQSLERRYTRMPIICPYYKEHSFKAHQLKCESAIAAGMATATTFYDKKLMLIHMRQYCRGDHTACPIGRACENRHKESPEQ